MGSCSTSSSIEDYSLKIAREAKMDIDSKIIPNGSWTDQVNTDQPFAKEPSNPQLTHKDNTVTSVGPSQHTQPHGNVHEHVAPAPSTPVVIPYDENQPANPSLWDGDFRRVSIFGI